MEQGLAEQLLPSHENDCQGERSALRPATSVASAYRLLTPSVKVRRVNMLAIALIHHQTFLLLFLKSEGRNVACTSQVQLLIYFMLKYAMEILLSESSVVTSYYFGWNTSTIAVFLAILGLTVLPVNAVVGTYISNMFEDRQILLASEVVLLAGILLSFRVTGTYTAAQYVCSALLTFVSAEVLEGVNLSLLSQVMSSRLSRGTYNGGLLSTEAGTLARVAADGTITLAGGILGRAALLNATLLPSLLICLASIAATMSTYNSLFY